MGTVLAGSTGRRLLIRRSRILLLAVVLAVVGLIAPVGDANTVSAAQDNVLSVSPSHTDLASEVTVTVFDSDLNVTVLQEFETTDSTGNLYELPIGIAGSTTIFKLKNAPVGDFNADGTVTAADVQISTSKASVQWVNKDSGTFQLVHLQTVSVAENFTVTYRSEQNDVTTVTLRSPSDPVGFTLSLRESTAISHSFIGTFKTGAATNTTGAADATSTTRPTIKVVDGDAITIEYADASPSKLISEAVVVDATKPSVSITTPAQASSTSNTTVWARAVVTDAGSGVELDQIKFHIDLDRDGIFDEAGEIVTASAIDSTAINQGWNASVLLPPVGTDGLVNWYVTATDRASNVGRSDSDAATGDQPNNFTVDTAPPGLVEVVLGEAYDATDKVTVGNVLNSVKVKWSEPIKESLIEPSRFMIKGQPAKTATMVTDVTDTVWLVFEEIPTSSELLTIMPGAVSDITEFPSELKEIFPIDKLGPRLTVSTDTAITNGLLTISVKTTETLTADPTVTINGVTFGSAQPVDLNEWSINVDGTTFTGAAAGDGVKNVEAAGFDAALNIARGGVAVEAPEYPVGAVQFQLDTVIKQPVVVPGDREVSTVSRPLITVSFAKEIGEYAGDTHPGVTIISALLDGIDVTSGFTAESASTWSYRPEALENTIHTLEVIGRDDAGNIHGAVVRVFSVDAPDPTPTPVPTEIPIPAPTVELPPTVVVAPTEIPTDEAQVAPATPEPVVTPEVNVPSGETAESTAVVDLVPVSTPEPQTSESTEVPEDGNSADAEAAPTPTEPESVSPDDAEEQPAVDDSDVSTAEDEPPVTEDDISATVAALRAADEEAAEAEGEDGVTIAPEPALTVFGCNIPTGGDGSVRVMTATGDYLIMLAGLLGLVVARVRPNRRKGEK